MSVKKTPRELSIDLEKVLTDTIREFWTKHEHFGLTDDVVDNTLISMSMVYVTYCAAHTDVDKGLTLGENFLKDPDTKTLVRETHRRFWRLHGSRILSVIRGT